MFLTALDIKQDSMIDADICIVGAGCAGITLASEFINTKLKVVLLESGGFEYDETTQSLYEGENLSANAFNLADTRLRYFGGATNHWGGMCHPLNAVDFQARPDIAYSGWPITLNDLIPFYQRAQKLCQLGEFVYDDESRWQQEIGFKPLPISGDNFNTSFFQYSPPTRFGEVYRETLKNAPNIDVILNANALTFDSNETAEHVTRVQVSHVNGHRFAVRAKQFVISAGGLETPRLLLLSNRVQKNGLGNDHDVVGRYYMDHLGHWGGTLQFSQDSSAYPWYFKLRTKAKVANAEVGALLTPSAALLKKEGILNFRLLFSPVPDEKGLDSAKYLAEEIKAGHFPDELGEHLKNVLSDMNQLTNLALKNLLHSNTDFFAKPKQQTSNAITRVTIDVNAEQLPNRNSRVMLSNQKDLFNQPRIKLDWQTSDLDKKTVQRALDVLALECGKQHFGRARLAKDIQKFGISSHHMGGTRMSHSPSDGVVNDNCRVHGIDNLFIASSSVFSTGGWANATLTITALSIRLADHLKSLLS